MAFYDKFPYTNFQELNLDWIISALKLLEKEQKEFINNNVIKYADPIKWNITSQYEANTVVTDVNGNAYISSQPVPTGVNITNDAYWSKIGNFDELWGAVKDAITTADEGAGTTATTSRSVNDLVWVQDKLLRVTAPMIAGDSYVIGSNCAVTDIDDDLKTLRTNISGFDAALQAEVTARQKADTTLQNNIDEEIENRTKADTTLQNNIDAVIPESGTAGMVLTKTDHSYEWKMPEMPAEHFAAMRKKMMVHRGFRESGNQFAQDNSVIALNLAGQYGFGGFECDPRKDVNGNIVLLHDADVSSVSNSTGTISSLNYADVRYKSKYNNIVNVGHLTTLHEAILIAQNYDMFIFFDMGKNVVTVAEIEEECEKLDFKNYGFFNTSSTAAMRDLPEYVLKVCGNDVFTHTAEELANYKDILGTSANVGVRLTQLSISRSQCELIKNAGFKIVLNYTDYFSIDPALYDYVDFILADTVFADDLMFTSKRACIIADEDFTKCIDKLTGNYSGVVIDYRNTGTNDLPAPGNNFTVIPVNLTSPNYHLVFAFDVITGFIYARMKIAGTWKSWVQLSNVSLNQ